MIAHLSGRPKRAFLIKIWTSVIIIVILLLFTFHIFICKTTGPIFTKLAKNNLGLEWRALMFVKMKWPCPIQRDYNFLITVYSKILSPFYFRPFCCCCPRANLRLGEFQCLKLSFFKHNFIWLNSRRGETACKWRRQK